jgi:branched-chain amino acid transport system substrate-binding protein
MLGGHKMNKITIVMLICTILLVAGCAQTQTTKSTFNVGFIGPLSGDAAAIGIPIGNGAQLAAEELGITFFKEDGKCNGKDALSAFTKLVNTRNIDAVIVTCSPELLAVAPAAKAAGVLVISPSATAPTITDAGEHVFRLAPSDALQGKEAARIMNTQGYNRVGVLYVNHDYGVGLNTVLQTELGSKIVASEAFAADSSDVRTELTKIKSKNVDVLYMVAFPNDAVTVLQQARELGLNVQIIAAEAAKSPEVLPYGDGIFITVPLAEGTGFQTFAAKYQSKFGEEPRVYSGEAYDTMRVVGLARTKSADLVVGMKQVSSFNGVAGNVVFDHNGDVAKPYNLFTIRGGEFVKI